MNNEKYNQIIDEAYDNYRAKAKLSQIPTDLTKEEFVELCKNDITFSVYWGLKIEERELSLEERVDYKKKRDGIARTFAPYTHQMLDGSNIPTKLITITYNNEKIESYV